MILQGDLQAAFDRLRAGTDEYHMTEVPAGAVGDDRLQFVAGVAGEMVAIGMRDLLVLEAQSLVDLRM